MPEINIDSTVLFWIASTVVGGAIVFLVLYFFSGGDE